MRVLITLAGGASSIEGDTPDPVTTMDKIGELLNNTKVDFIILDNTSYGDVVVNKSAISYIRRKQ